MSAAPVIFDLNGKRVFVTGHAEGTALIFPSQPDVGERYVLLGTGQVGEMGQVAVHGTLQTNSYTGRPM